MKSRKLSAAELRLKLSAADIKSIPYRPTSAFPADPAAKEAAATAVKLRGCGKNIFIAGPASAERLSLIIAAAEEAAPAEEPAVALFEEGGGGRTPALSLRMLNADEAAKAEESAGFVKLLTPGCSGKPPLIIENDPVPHRLFGRCGDTAGETEAGSLMRSAGGLLILNADDLLLEEESWIRLKRALRSGASELGERKPGLKTAMFGELRQDYKVAILGTEQHYDHFYNNDEDFRELFSFFAEIDSTADFDDENLSLSINHLRTFAERNLNREISPEALLEAVKHSRASAENMTKLSTSLSDIDIIFEEAALLNEGPISADSFIRAVGRQTSRFSLLERKILDDMESGEINLRVDGREIGKVNGLAVIDKGPYSFGFPGLISARIAPGENGLVNIEHEAGLSGEIHDKWVLILEGFLRSRFALDFPISIFASICFEQSYSEVDGDSASSSELYALLSAISGIPVRQDIAVTGSLSQTGEIQAVGGLREKIEGFYKTCRRLGYTGEQGVIIPEKNINHIILPDEIIDEIENGRFHIYPVATVNDSMEILTGMEAGSRNSRGMFPHGSVNRMIEKNLRKLAQQAKGGGG